MSLFAALKSSGWVLFNKRDSIYENRIGHKRERNKRGKQTCKLQVLETFCLGASLLRDWMGKEDFQGSDMEMTIFPPPYCHSDLMRIRKFLHRTLDFSSSSKMALLALVGGGGRGLSSGSTGSCFTIPGRGQGCLSTLWVKGTAPIPYIKLYNQQTSVRGFTTTYDSETLQFKHGIKI